MAITAKLSLLALFVVCAIVVAKPDAATEDVEVDEKAVDYAKGSLCGYCRYCTVSLLSLVCYLLRTQSRKARIHAILKVGARIKPHHVYENSTTSL